MKKCSVITGMILASLLLFMNSCEKDYLNAEEISYSLTVSDTVYLNEPVTIKGVINQDLDIRVYWENWNNDHLIGVLKPYRDSIVWIPENIKEGPANLLTQIAYKSGRKNQTNLMGGKNIVIKKKITFRITESFTTSSAQIPSRIACSINNRHTWMGFTYK